jgi:hypothetical protein
VKLGARQAFLLDLARIGSLGFIRPRGFLDRRALRRLERRGLVAQALGFPDTWTIKK